MDKILKQIPARLLASAVILFYISARILPNRLWEEVSPYWAYALEFAFVILAFLIYRQRVQFKTEKFFFLIGWIAIALLSGFLVYRAAVFVNIPIPIDLRAYEVLFLLLVLAPILEELIFRMALWEALKDLLSRNSLTLVASAALFSLGHFITLWSVPEEFRVFILYQALYVILLGLATGWARIATGSIIPPILIHGGFNFGFFLASI